MKRPSVCSSGLYGKWSSPVSVSYLMTGLEMSKNIRWGSGESVYGTPTTHYTLLPRHQVRARTYIHSTPTLRLITHHRLLPPILAKVSTQKKKKTYCSELFRLHFQHYIILAQCNSYRRKIFTFYWERTCIFTGKAANAQNRLSQLFNSFRTFNAFLQPETTNKPFSVPVTTTLNS